MSEIFATGKGLAAGTLILLATFKPDGGWSRHAAIALAGRFGAGLGFALGGTELAQWVYAGIPVAPVAAVLMAYGLQIGRHVERWIDMRAAALTTPKPKD